MKRIILCFEVRNTMNARSMYGAILFLHGQKDKIVRQNNLFRQKYTGETY
jgi:hypothetical protein